MGTAILFTDQGWQPSFRIHSGDGLAKPTLKLTLANKVYTPQNFSA